MQFFSYVYYRKWDYPSILKADLQAIKLIICSKINPFFSQKANSRFFFRFMILNNHHLYVLEICCFSKSRNLKNNQVKYDEFDLFSFNLIFLPAVPWEVQVWNWLHFQSCKLDISNKEKYHIQLENVKNQVQIDRGSVKFEKLLYN